MEGYKHLITVIIFSIGIFFTSLSRTAKVLVILAFSLGAFWIDLDHYKLGLKELFTGMFSFDKMQCKERIGCALHKPIFFYISLAFTLGLFIHFKMDGIL